MGRGHIEVKPLSPREWVGDISK